MMNKNPALEDMISPSSTTNESSPTSNAGKRPMTTSTSSSSSVDHKRRRVTRACDTCRSKKVKCDGRQPCIHCTVYSFRCTYDQPNVRNKKNTGIPKAVDRASSSFANSTVGSINGVPIDSYPTKNLIIAQQVIGTLLPNLRINFLDQNLSFDLDRFQRAVSHVEHRSSALTNSLKDVSEMTQDPDAIIPPPRTYSVSAHSDDSTLPQSPCEIKLMLPPKEEALRLIYTTWTKACVLFRFYHRPSMLEEIDLLYSLDPSQYGDRQQKFLPFLYSSLACGSLFSKSPYTNSTVNDDLEDDGFKYFLEARKLIDISNVGDCNSIQIIIMMIIYLQCSARLSTCYSYIGIALRSALKEGLHRNLSVFQNSRRKLDTIEVDTRKRMFFTIYKMDIYINSLLGLPRYLHEDEFDQELPVDMDDENITRSGYDYEKQDGKLSSSGCANYHTKLMFIMSHIIKKLYPVKVTNVGKNPGPDDIHRNVTELEIELKTWLNNLPKELQPTDPNSSKIDVPEKFVLANCYLQLAFLNCQIMLYRPFIHFISDSRSGRSSDPRSLIRGRNCIKIARMVVKLANKMIDEKLLIGTYWFSLYTIFFSIACLVYYYHFANYNNNGLGANYAGVLFDDDLNIDIIKKDIEIGKKVLDCLKNSSTSSLRIYNILNTLFEQLNRKTASRSLVKNSLRNDSSSAATAPLSSSSSSTLSAPPVASKAVPVQQAEQFKSDKIKTTFKNFDQNNQYAQPDKKDDLGQYFENHNIDRFQSTLEIPREITNIAKLSPVKEEENEEIGSKAGADLTDNYMPGVFDKLDSQIFGKILPPYMTKNNEILSNLQQQHSLQSQQQQQQSQQPQQLQQQDGSIGDAQVSPSSNANDNSASGMQNQNEAGESGSATVPEDILDFDELISSLNNANGFEGGYTNDGGPSSIDYMAPL
ncbi:uncharacterized protein LODBEIA_P08730 [Lodderomyces beijingensis]|uniref:Zn(2)-C6 fungal-type domain-containing protein n=1 Tax=Lodderomyces beijingensis TaxID=1775926 RepID=A0ABP0ZFN0_9ASCO